MSKVTQPTNVGPVQNAGFYFGDGNEEGWIPEPIELFKAVLQSLNNGWSFARMSTTVSWYNNIIIK